MSETATVDVFHAASMQLDNRFLPNFGGDGSNALSRSIYEIIPYESETKPSLVLELYAKFNAQQTDQRELHGNLILHGHVDDLSKVYMGFLFSPDPINGTFDGLQVSATVDRLETSAANNVFAGFDLWTKTRPFTTTDFDPSSDFSAESGFDASNDWNITGAKSSTNCNA